MLNIERYRDELKKCKLVCEIYRIRKESEGENGFCCVKKPCSECRKENIEWLLAEYEEPKDLGL